MQEKDRNSRNCGPLAEREGFEPSCGFSHKLISSQPRYDRFDISPYEIVFEFCDVSVMCRAETLRAKLKKTRAFER